MHLAIVDLNLDPGDRIARNHAAIQHAANALLEFSPPYVIKASGLAAGKGVWIGSAVEEALSISKEFLTGHESLVIEEFLEGTEVSCFYLVDGNNFEFFGTAQDHKRLLDGDQGPNTGGMGAISPSPEEHIRFRSQIEDEIIKPTLLGLEKMNLSYCGFLFLGLMLVKGKSYVLEYNCRMGDPETQCLLQRLESDLWKSISDLHKQIQTAIQFKKEQAVTVVVAAKGYPTDPVKGTSLGEWLQSNELQIFHSGTKKEGSSWLANGGRLFTVNTNGTIKAAREKIYTWIFNWQKSLGPQQNQIIYRTDVGEKYE